MWAKCLEWNNCVPLTTESAFAPTKVWSVEIKCVLTWSLLVTSLRGAGSLRFILMLPHLHEIGGLDYNDYALGYNNPNYLQIPGVGFGHYSPLLNKDLQTVSQWRDWYLNQNRNVFSDLVLSLQRGKKMLLAGFPKNILFYFTLF